MACDISSSLMTHTESILDHHLYQSPTIVTNECVERAVCLGRTRIGSSVTFNVIATSMLMITLSLVGTPLHGASKITACFVIR